MSSTINSGSTIQESDMLASFPEVHVREMEKRRETLEAISSRSSPRMQETFISQFLDLEV
jgi:UDP-N-acetylglucosamine 2-epimerase